MEGIEVGTRGNFCGEDTSDVRSPDISGVGDASSWDLRRSRSGIGGLHYPSAPDLVTSHHRVALGGSSPSSSSISMTSTGVVWSVLTTSPVLLDPSPGKVELGSVPDSGIPIDVVGTGVAVGAPDDRVGP